MSGRYLVHSRNTVNLLVCIRSVIKLQRSDDDLVLGRTMSRSVA